MAEQASQQGESRDQRGDRKVVVGDQQCPRCREWFTISYWNGEFLVQAHCFSCELRWPRPDVV